MNKQFEKPNPVGENSTEPRRGSGKGWGIAFLILMGAMIAVAIYAATIVDRSRDTTVQPGAATTQDVNAEP